MISKQMLISDALRGELPDGGNAGRSAGIPAGRSRGPGPLEVVAKPPQDWEHRPGAGKIDELVGVGALVE
jgi:hypothetical protein